tara:strand:- start:434 stop:616 length:183 start_codon:yes stop_codon:yes gene_type:complete
MKEDINDFLEDLASNTPHEGQFKDVDKLKESNMKEVEEDLVGGKSLKKFKDEIKKGEKDV